MNVCEQYDRYKQLALYITQKTSVEIRLKILNEYGNIIDDYMEMKLNGAFFGSYTGVLAHEKLVMDALVRPITPDGQSVYHGHLFVRKDSGIKNVRDMKGLAVI